MCGIVGLADKNNMDLILKMRDLLCHRGPDDCGEFRDNDNGIALAMRRLSIIDLDSGKQPMTNEDKNLWVVCNGEIYNSPELRERLINKGHVFSTKNSDTEILLHLYEDEGVNMLKDLNGMFAFVIYDKRKKVLFGARDRIGIKPFYYAAKNGKFAFASELKSLLLLPWVSKDIDCTSLYHYISLQFVPSPNSIFCDIKKLSAGHFFIYNLNTKQISIKKYWGLNVNNIVENRSKDEWKDVIREKLKESVKRWTLSDVPIACSLSGGLDSSALVGVLAESGIKDIRTYSLGFEAYEEQNYNELPLARKVSEKWGTKHHEVVLDSKKVLGDLENMVWHLDEPYGGGLPSWYIYEIISKDVKVALTGTGGDELFSNYGKYEIHERPVLYRYSIALKKALKTRSFREVVDSFNFPIGHFYHSYFSDSFKDKAVFSNPTGISTEKYIQEIWESSNTHDPRNAVAYTDFKLQLPEEFLLVTDRFSMAHSVEARTPFLDHTFVETIFTMPPLTRTGGNKQKSLFKETIIDLLPKELLNVSKRGFVLPLDIWIKKDLKNKIQDILSPSYIKNQGIFSTNICEKILKPHFSGKINYTQQIWTLFMFQLWHAKYCS